MMKKQRIQKLRQLGILALIYALSLIWSNGTQAQQVPQAATPVPVPEQNRAYIAPPNEYFASNLGIYYRLEPYGNAQGARLSRHPVTGSPAAQLLLEPGDLIISLDNMLIYGPNDVLNHLAQTSVQFVNIRTGQPQTNWVYVPPTSPPPPPGGGPPSPPPPVPLPYTLGVATVLTSLGNQQIYSSGYVGAPPPTAYQPTYGLRINHVSPGSPAQRSGLEVGDIVLSANGMPMNDALALQRAISASNGYLNLVIRNVRPPYTNVSVSVALQPTGGQIYAAPAASAP